MGQIFSARRALKSKSEHENHFGLTFPLGDRVSYPVERYNLPGTLLPIYYGRLPKGSPLWAHFCGEKRSDLT